MTERTDQTRIIIPPKFSRKNVSIILRRELFKRIDELKKNGSKITHQTSNVSRQPSRRRKTLPDGKPFGGSAGRMTDAMKTKISQAYSLTIRQGSAACKGSGLVQE